MQRLSRKLGIIVASIMQGPECIPRPEPVGMLEKLMGRVGVSAALDLARSVLLAETRVFRIPSFRTESSGHAALFL